MSDDNAVSSPVASPRAKVANSAEMILRQIFVDRLEGATAMARGEFERGKDLVLAALAASQKHGLRAEEARCLR